MSESKEIQVATEAEVIEANDVPKPQNHVNQFIEMTERIAMNPDVDVDKMKAILEIQKEVMNKQAEIEYNKAMTALKKELMPVVKNKKNNQTNSKYADLAEIKKSVDPLLAKHGFFDSYSDEFPEDGVIITTCTITHEQGFSRSNSVRFKRDNVGIKGTANKTDIHGDASTMTYGQRLSLCRALGIRIADDDDGNAAGAVPITEEQRDFLQGLIEDTGSDIAKLCEYAKVKSLAEITQLNYPKIKNALLKKRNEQIKEKEEKADDNT